MRDMSKLSRDEGNQLYTEYENTYDTMNESTIAELRDTLLDFLHRSIDECSGDPNYPHIENFDPEVKIFPKGQKVICVRISDKNDPNSGKTIQDKQNEAHETTWFADVEIDDEDHGMHVRKYNYVWFGDFGSEDPHTMNLYPEEYLREVQGIINLITDYVDRGGYLDRIIRDTHLFDPFVSRKGQLVKRFKGNMGKFYKHDYFEAYIQDAIDENLLILSADGTQYIEILAEGSTPDPSSFGSNKYYSVRFRPVSDPEDFSAIKRVKAYDLMDLIGDSSGSGDPDIELVSLDDIL